VCTYYFEDIKANKKVQCNTNSSNTKVTTFVADYSFDEWSSLNIKGAGWSLVNSNRISAGAEFSSIKKTLHGGMQRNSIQFGGFLNNSYLKVNNYQINEWGVTTGITSSLRGGMRIGASLEAGVRGTSQANLIKENYIQLNLNFLYLDFFNSKGRRYD